MGDPLFAAASFRVPKHKKAGLVGLNGAGKSTLFKLILGEEYPDEGRLVVDGATILVPQEVTRDPALEQAGTIGAYVRGESNAHDDRIRVMMDNIELSHLALDKEPRQLSGGQKTKLAILRALLREPENLLMDEPTNFLDTAGTKWVMHVLSQYKKTLLVVSHDLDLLDRQIDKIIYINKQRKTIEEYSGGYSSFLRLKTEKDAYETRQIRNQQQQLKRMKQSLVKLYRNTSDKGVRQRKQMSKRIEKLESSLPELPRDIVQMKLTLPTPAWVGEVPVWVKHVGKSYGDTSVLKDVSLTLRKGMRMALIGQNGAGKSTLIKIVMGMLTPDQGEVAVNEQAHIGLYSQEFETFDMRQSMLEMLMSETGVSEGMARGFLAKFMFRNNQVLQSIGSLSGGEKTRLSMAKLMLKNYNVLILDEPTTYLDVQSQAIIMGALQGYTGAMLVVSHTPDFLRGLKPEKAYLLPEEKEVYWEDSLATRAAEM